MWPWGPVGPQHMWETGWGWLGIVGMILNMLLWLALLVGVVVLIVSATRRSRSSGPRYGDRATRDDLTPREILQQRYARGEITREQYFEMVADLDGGERPSAV